MRRLAAAAAVLALLAASTGCGQGRTAQAAGPVPDRSLPATIAGYSTKLEPSAQKAFASAGSTSLTAHGAVWTLRQNGAVRGALQVGVLKPDFRTDDIDVRRGIRANIETGQYRWFKLDGQWVGVQDLPELELYLWYPPRGDLYEVLQLQPDVTDQKRLLAEILRYQKGGS